PRSAELSQCLLASADTVHGVNARRCFGEISPPPERFSENKGGTGNLPVLAGYQPSRFRQHRTVSACDAPNSAASCRRTQPGWLCYPVQLNRYGKGEGEARTVPGIFTPFGVELLRGDLRQGYGIEAAFENVSCREARMPRHWAP